jgi:hypothetical protein
MKNEFVTYEQALALKELGFDEPCFGRWIEQDELSISAPKDDEYCQKQHEFSWTALALLKQQAFKWFREKHELQHEIIYDLSDNLTNKVYVYSIFGVDRSEEYKTYEDAEEGCINELIKIVKNGK